MSRTQRPLVAVIATIAALALAACSSNPTVVNSQTVEGGTAAVSPSPWVSSPPATAPSPTASLTPSPSQTSKKPAISQATGPAGKPGEFVFPVVGNYTYGHTHHDYPATDIITACGNEVRAVTSGVILEVTRVDTWTAKVNAGATRGGLSVSIKGDDGVRYYGSHFEEINTNIQPGVRVTTGEPLGKVGRTGDASACHLHFGISPICAGVGDWWNQRGVIWPWPYLDSWRSGGEKSPVAEITAWHAANGCPTHALTDP
jgi:murein DD-endopeptidase MepM/ murein hydrolase activator NlpD